MLIFTRITDEGLAAYVCRQLLRHNHVKRTPNNILCSPHYAIYAGDNLVGWIGYRRRSRTRAEIMHLTVLPHARHEGVAQEAIAYVSKLLGQKGATTCYAHIRSYNKASIGLFEKQGFMLVRRGDLILTYARRRACRTPPSLSDIPQRQPSNFHASFTISRRPRLARQRSSRSAREASAKHIATSPARRGATS